MFARLGYQLSKRRLNLGVGTGGAIAGALAESQLRRLSEELGARSVAIVQTTLQFDAAKRILAAFVDEVRPLLWE